MRLLFVFAVIAVAVVIGIDCLTNKPLVPMDEWACMPGLHEVQTNNGTFYYRD